MISLDKKVLFITGKGGVGKSTITSMISYNLSAKKKKVLVIDADPAHSMPDVFGITDKFYDRDKFISRINLTKVYDDLSLDLLVLNPTNVRSKYTGNHRIMWLAELGKELGFFSHLDRMSEFFTLADTIYKLYREYDYFVIDNEPSAGTLDMIDNIDGWLKALDNVSKYKLIFQALLSSNLLDNELVSSTKSLLFNNNGRYIEDFKRTIKSIKLLFTDANRFYPIIVSSPEDAVIRETYRLKQEILDRLGINVGCLIFNKMKENQIDKIKNFLLENIICYSVPQIQFDQVNLLTEEGARVFINNIETKFKILKGN